MKISVKQNWNTDMQARLNVEELNYEWISMTLRLKCFISKLREYPSSSPGFKVDIDQIVSSENGQLHVWCWYAMFIV